MSNSIKIKTPKTKVKEKHETSANAPFGGGKKTKGSAAKPSYAGKNTKSFSTKKV